MFTDRLEAGSLLAQKLNQYKDQHGVVLAVPRGGVPLGYIVARDLNLPLELLLSKKIGHPENEEYAIGAASLTDRYLSSRVHVSPEYIEAETARVRARLQAMKEKFIGDHQPESLEGKTVIVIDDGIATGLTLMGSIQMLRSQKPKKIVIAVPVAPRGTLDKISQAADEVVCLLIPEEFYGVGAFYENFEQVSDEEVLYYLKKHREEYVGVGKAA
ncbi:MAG: phosphoribosyltransferase family protein [Saprospiraceae bacterium]|nr:phosphoribosyltransferase family protein [Saprospiraceae bacterium]